MRRYYYWPFFSFLARVWASFGLGLVSLACFASALESSYPISERSVQRHIWVGRSDFLESLFVYIVIFFIAFHNVCRHDGVYGYRLMLQVSEAP